MKTTAVPAWIKDEWALLSYLTHAHDGHPYAEELLEGISLLTSWVLVVISIVSIVAVVGDAILR
ncbi:MAG TPA: hypothetical protein VL262_18180 [Vicinamibacterales bacterium]|jgi:hypothetical protein|nr:hypothetical protein [Vicinamibacterales bacterium]